ncbi:MAG: hypothetical protein IPM54_37710 [Polyangiaceae bacterium]|nr:hypothetical protein [Polyangiaceae bacterium]
MRVSLLTTGIMEFRGLAAALQKLFPDHEFHVEPYAPGKPFHGFTSCTVQLLPPGNGSGKAGTMLRAALGTLVPPDTATPPSDLAYVVEDLELVNKGNERIMIEHVRESARRTISNIGSAMDPAFATRLMRERVSFHLAVPMPESWFFGDFSALQTEVPSAYWPPNIAPNRDPEDFLTDDPAYDADDGSACKGFASGRMPSWISARRKEHPKKYLEWLMRDHTLGDCSKYLEQHEGVRLLGKLNWPTVLATSTWFPYLRALVRDLEAALGSSAVGIPTGGDEAPLTSMFNERSNPILRNL